MARVLSVPSVTGVDLNLDIAGPGARSYAFIIDWHIRFLAAIAWFFGGTLLLLGGINESGGNSESYVFMVILPSLALYFLYHPVIELIMAGRRPGKRIAGVRVVTTDGALPGVGAILIRNVFRLIDSLPIAYCVGLTATILTQRSVRLGDLAAGTVLVYDEPDATGPVEFSGAVLGAVGLERYELARDLLSRWDSLGTGVRADLARKLLRKLDRLPRNDTDQDLLEALAAVVEGRDIGGEAGETRAGEARAGETRAGETRAGETRAGETSAGGTRAGGSGG